MAFTKRHLRMNDRIIIHIAVQFLRFTASERLTGQTFRRVLQPRRRFQRSSHEPTIRSVPDFLWSLTGGDYSINTGQRSKRKIKGTKKSVWHIAQTDHQPN